MAFLYQGRDLAKDEIQGRAVLTAPEPTPLAFPAPLLLTGPRGPKAEHSWENIPLGLSQFCNPTPQAKRLAEQMTVN